MEMVDYKCKEIGFFIDNIESQTTISRPLIWISEQLAILRSFLSMQLLEEKQMSSPQKSGTMEGFLLNDWISYANHKDPANAFGIILQTRALRAIIGKEDVENRCLPRL